ncbi:DUF4058 family protein [Nostoc punctiforme FACHB-252]|jgi:hypothetical protein|uniref:DUF4058 family protein n=1 Tax=Nostoc punctiforme FACHB-252 TaxID=1357509 RepID=A0ABR8HI18_NOSPU|nr:DUF4058 family protein [Nostoc punctiforme]MBD2614690.1 DUF4058 family protein [Nostoc punctiforme FACHB-252]
MPSPFPGMNPYLEDSALWPGVHGRLIVAIADSLSPQLRPKYFVAIEERIYQTTGDDRLLVGIPDVIVKNSQTVVNPKIPNVAVAVPAVQPKTVTVPIPETIKERYLEVRKVGTKEVVTAIEVLSPKNKRPGEGRDAYETKRQRVLGSLTNFVEIDLLRAGEPMLVFGDGMQNDYRILVSRAENRPQSDLYAFNLPDIIPSFPLPLRTGDNEPFVDLQSLLAGIYERGSYDLVIDYSQQPALELSQENAVWVDTVLRDKGLRSKNV